MGRRSRRRTTSEPRKEAGVGGQTARVSVDDATWRDFRRAIGDRSVAQALGSFVESEVVRWHRRRAADATLTEVEAAEAIERARTLAEALRLLAERLEWRLRYRR